MNWWRALSFAGFLLGWLERASRDGRITSTEMIELISAAVQHFGLDVVIEVDPPPQPREPLSADGGPMGRPGIHRGT